MTRRIVILSIVLGLLVLLSGCDAVLEWFYPEFAEENKYQVDVKINLQGDINTFLANKDDYEMSVTLYDAGTLAVVSGASASMLYNEGESIIVEAPAGDYFAEVYWEYDPAEVAQSVDFTLSEDIPYEIIEVDLYVW